MKKTLVKSLALAVFVTALATAPASALTYTFNDTVNYWAGYGNGTADDVKDVIGSPKVGGMMVTINDNTKELEKVVVNLADRRVFDSLFINSNLTGGENLDAWDYMARDNDDGDLGSFNKYKLWDSYMNTPGLYSVATGFAYTYVPTLETGFREDHPNGIQARDLTLINNSDFIGYDGSSLITYDFSSLAHKIVMGDMFVVGYAPWCANDVTINHPVPEPATMLLLGTGLAGLAAARRRKTQK